MDLDIQNLKEPQKDEIVVFRFSCEKMDYDVVYRIYNQLRELFPNNTVMAIPNDTELSIIDKDSFEKWMAAIQKAGENKEAVT